jgi:hypothetical protein
VHVTLPSNVTCEKCTLQVIEFMSDHPLNNPGGCFYHHCADIAIGVDAGTPPDDGGVSSGDDGGAGDDAGGAPQNGAAGSSGGCAIANGGTWGTTLGAVVFALGALVRRRRKA